MIKISKINITLIDNEKINEAIEKIAEVELLLDMELCVNDIYIVRNVLNNNTYIWYPLGYKERFIANPITNEARVHLEEEILRAYNNKLQEVNNG